ncbi:MAG: biopolymer transporter ExbD [Myxococcales bacterium]|nr:biopolymer transporter ExbD [Myxococcales bacterium]
MPVSTPGKSLYRPGLFRKDVVEKYALYSQIPLLTVRRKVLGGGHKGVNTDLNLTSMIDYLVITVVFLLSQFGTQQQVQSTSGLEVPTVPHADNLTSAPVVSISDRAVLMDSQRIISPQELGPGTDRIDRLYERLDAARREWPVLHPDRPFEGDVIFQIDRGVSWQTIKTVARTCAAAGFTRLNFAVTKGNAPPAND